MFLSAKQGLPFMQAPVPEAAVLGDDPAGLRSLKAERLNALLVSQLSMRGCWWLSAY